MMKLHNRVAIVTGASSGIGREIVNLFLPEGAHVIATSQNISNKFIVNVEKWRNLSNQLLIIKGDVTKDSDIKKIVNQTINNYGKIDILINNAGITDRTSALNSTESNWEKVLKTNLTGSFLVSRSVLPHMIKKKSGSIIFISSIGAIVSWENEASYQASKGGLVSLTRSMAVDYAPYNIRVNCVCPGLIDAPMFTSWLKQIKHNKNLLEDILSKIPLKRLGSPREVAKAVLFLASDDASYITGTSLIINGGYTAI